MENENYNNEEEETQHRVARARRETLTTIDDETIDLIRVTIKRIDELMDESVTRRKTGIYLQLLRIVSGSSTQSQAKNASSSYNYYNKMTRDKGGASFTRLFLCSDYMGGTGQVVYIIESRCQNERLWMRNPSLRDSGDITVGCVFLVLNPPPIKLLLGGEIPILKTRGGCVLMKCPNFQPTV